MPLTVPAIDARRYADLRDEGLARVRVHNPEWTNFNKSDPGVTLIEVFAFLTESLLYRANQIPERNRLKFLKLLGIPLQPASAARARRRRCPPAWKCAPASCRSGSTRGWTCCPWRAASSTSAR